jgi:hypothetical protein
MCLLLKPSAKLAGAEFDDLLNCDPISNNSNFGKDNVRWCTSTDRENNFL